MFILLISVKKKNSKFESPLSLGMFSLFQYAPTEYLVNAREFYSHCGEIARSMFFPEDLKTYYKFAQKHEPN